jgi:hypothetical protein
MAQGTSTFITSGTLLQMIIFKKTTAKQLALTDSTLSDGLLLTAVTDTFGGGATVVDMWLPLLRPNVLLVESKL